MRYESSPWFLALFNKCFFWSGLTGMITRKTADTTEELDCTGPGVLLI